MPKFLYYTVKDGSKEVPLPETISIRPPLSIEHRLETDRDRQTQAHDHSVARVIKNTNKNNDTAN